MLSLQLNEKIKTLTPHAMTNFENLGYSTNDGTNIERPTVPQPSES